MPESLRYFVPTLLHGSWSWGWQSYQGKPRFALCYVWYDCPHYCLHIGPLWVEVDA
jgi:hypothetical protein